MGLLLLLLLVSVSHARDAPAPRVAPLEQEVVTDRGAPSSSSSRRWGSCSFKGVSGTCMSLTSCTGTLVKGRCPGPTAIQCCLPKRPSSASRSNWGSCSSNGVTGTCMSLTSCNNGTLVKGLCPGPTAIQCCLPRNSQPSPSRGGITPFASPQPLSGGNGAQMKGVDCTRPVAVETLSAEGVQFVVRYVLGGSWKRLQASEIPTLHGAGIRIGVVAEAGTDQMGGGFSAGAADARLASSQATGAGAPTDIVIYFAHDEQTDLVSIKDYLDGAISVLGPNRVGIYGGRDAILAARDHFQAKYPSGRIWLWQTLAWSGPTVVSGIDIYQGGSFTWGGSYARDSWNGCDKDTAWGSAGLW